MFPYETIVTEREVYKDRLAEAERRRRDRHMTADEPSLWERTTFRLGDLLIAAGKGLQHQRVDGVDAPVVRTQRKSG